MQTFVIISRGQRLESTDIISFLSKELVIIGKNNEIFMPCKESEIDKCVCSE